MMWNHRVIRHKQHPSRKDTTYWYGIHEVYYNDEGFPEMYTENPVGVLSEDWNVYTEEGCINEMRETLNRMLKCLDKPILEEEDFTSSS